MRQLRRLPAHSEPPRQPATHRVAATVLAVVFVIVIVANSSPLPNIWPCHVPGEGRVGVGGGSICSVAEWFSSESCTWVDVYHRNVFMHAFCVVCWENLCVSEERWLAFKRDYSLQPVIGGADKSIPVPCRDVRVCVCVCFRVTVFHVSVLRSGVFLFAGPKVWSPGSQQRVT